MMAAPFITKRPTYLKAFRIAPADSNYFACTLDPLADGLSFTLVVEIFEPAGKTPPNSHDVADRNQNVAASIVTISVEDRLEGGRDVTG